MYWTRPLNERPSLPPKAEFRLNACTRHWICRRPIIIADLGYPGEYPYTRGVYPTMYRGRLWTMRNYAGFGTAEDTNKRFRYLLEQGMPGLSVAFDLPTQIGYDSDHPMSEGAVGRVGVAVDTLADMEIIFRRYPVGQVSTSMTINSPATVLLAMYIAVGEKQGVPKEKLMGTTQNDILKEFIARGTYIFPPEPSLKLTLDVIEYCYRHVPRWNTLSITGYHFREAGARCHSGARLYARRLHSLYRKGGGTGSGRR